MSRQKSHAYFNMRQQPANTHSLPISNTLPRSQSNIKATLKQSTLNQSRNSNTSHQRSLTRSGIYLTTDNKRGKKDKQIEKLYQQLNHSKMKIRQLEEKQIENFVLRKQNQMYRLELQKIKEEIKIYSMQHQKSSQFISDSSKLFQVNQKYQILTQHNLDNLKLIGDLKKEVNHYINENKKLKEEIVNQQQIVQRVKSIETQFKKLQVEIQSQAKQWEIQKNSFIEILHAEIQESKKKGW